MLRCLYEVLRWIRTELGLSLDKSPVPNVINGKKLKSEILPKLKFSLKHSNYKSGYHQMMTKLNKTNGQNID